MAILFDVEKKIFKLDTASSSYVFAVHDSGRLLHLYYGAYLPDCDMRYLLDRGYFGSFTPDAAGYVGTEFSPDTQPSEYSCNGTGDFRMVEPGIIHAVDDGLGNESWCFMGDAGRLHGNVAGEVAEFLLRRYFQCDVGIVAGWKSAGCNSLVQGFRNALLQ